jgi:hypothetical protein
MARSALIARERSKALREARPPRIDRIRGSGRATRSGCRPVSCLTRRRARSAARPITDPDGRWTREPAPTATNARLLPHRRRRSRWNLVVETADARLREIGEVLDHAYQGELDCDFEPVENVERVSRSRSAG